MRKRWIAVVLVGVAVFVIWAVVRIVDFVPQQPTRAAQPDSFRDLHNALHLHNLALIDTALDPNAPTDRLIEAVKSADDNLAGYAAWVLGLRAERRAVDALIERMKRREMMAGQWCPWALGRIGEARAVEPLIGELEKTTRVAARARPVKPSSRWDPNRSPTITTSAVNGLDICEETVIRALGALGDPRAVDVLVARLRACTADVYGNTRCCCEDALTQIGPPAVPALIEALADSDRQTAQSVMLVLGLIGDSRGAGAIIKRLAGPAPAADEHNTHRFDNIGLISLAKIGTPEAMEYLARCPVPHVSQEHLMPIYVKELLARSPESLDALLHLVKTQHSVPGPEASAELGRLKDPRSIPVLIETFGTVQDDSAVIPLMAIGPPAIDALAQALAGAGRGGYKAILPIRTLAGIGDPAARPALWQYIRKNARGWETGEALTALAQLGDPNVVGEARQWLEDWPENGQAVQYAINALSRLVDKDSIPQIAKIARTPVVLEPRKYAPQYAQSARVAAMNALLALGAPETGEIALQAVAEPFGTDLRLHAAAVNALAALKHPQAEEVLMEISRRPVSAELGPAKIHLVALAAMERLQAQGQARPAGLGEALRRLVKQASGSGPQEDSAVVAAAAADLLRRSPDANGFQQLTELLNEWDMTAANDEPRSAYLPDETRRKFVPVAASLCQAIATSGHERSLDILVYNLGAEKKFVRDAAAEALGVLGDKKAVRPLIECLERSDTKGQRTFDNNLIINSLLKLDPDRVAGPLANWLDKDARSWRPGEQRLIQELGRLGCPESAGAMKRRIEYLMLMGNCAQESPMFFDYYEGAAESMRKHGDRYYGLPVAFARCADKTQAVELLTVVLRGREWQLRMGAAEGLGIVADARAVGPLVTALRDRAWPVQEAAAVALGQILDPAAIEALEAATRQGDRRVRQAARQALETVRKSTAADVECPPADAKRAP